MVEADQDFDRRVAKYKQKQRPKQWAGIVLGTCIDAMDLAPNINDAKKVFVKNLIEQRAPQQGISQNERAALIAGVDGIGGIISCVPKAKIFDKWCTPKLAEDFIKRVFELLASEEKEESENFESEQDDGFGYDGDY